MSSPLSCIAGLVALAMVACTASGPPPPSAPPAVSVSAPTPGPGTQATFILVNAAGLIALDRSCHPIGRLVEIPPQSAAATPGLSLDHKRVAFALTGQPDPKTGFGTDIYEVNIDGTGLHRLIAHEAANVFYDSPRYDPKGDAIYVHKRSAIQKNSQYIGNEDLIERIDLATQQHGAVVHDGMDPTIAPDGARMTYVHLTNSLPDGLWSAGLPDGAGALRLLAHDSFTYLQTPRFSPDGSQIVFSAAGHQTSVLGGGREAHLGIPSQLYLASADGEKLTLLGQTLDDVVPAWSPDGTRVAYVGIGSFVIMTIADQSTVVCAQGEQFFFGDPLWLK